MVVKLTVQESIFISKQIQRVFLNFIQLIKCYATRKKDFIEIFMEEKISAIKE